jgi:hypothetical protein
MNMVEEIRFGDALFAIIVSGRFRENGVNFFTPNAFSQQVAFIRHPGGTAIPPHVHNPVSREVQYTSEVLIIRKGRLRVDFYSDQHAYLDSRTLESGDLIVLVQGGHGFKVIDEVEMIEVKQGPYAGDADKTRFEASGPG